MSQQVGVRGLDDDPDQVLRSPGRWLLVGLVLAWFGFIAWMFAGDAFASPAPGEDRDWFHVATGASWLVFGLTVVVGVWPPRRRVELTAAVSKRGNLTLPVRRSLLVSNVSGPLLIGALGAGTVAAVDSLVPRLLGIAMVAAGVAGVGLMLRGHRRGDDAIVLTPHGVSVPSRPVARRTPLAWDDLAEVGVVGGARPRLVLTSTEGGSTTCLLQTQAWPPHALLEVLDHYRRAPAARAELTSPTALQRFR